MKLLAVVSALLLSCAALAGNYADCILDKMPGSENEAVTAAVVSTCIQENPNGFYEIEKGDGRGLFGYKNANACVLKKARDTRYPRAAGLISASCRCLYDEALIPGETCAQRPFQPQRFEPFTEKPEEVKPKPVATMALVLPVPPTAPPLPLRLYEPSREELKEADRQRAYAAQVQADLNLIGRRAIDDYPYLGTPQGHQAMAKIAEKRDELILQGIYPSIALTRAINDYAPAFSPGAKMQRKPIPITDTTDKGNHNGFDPKCRWVTSQDWSCK